ncbi:MAG: hypothetical protein QM725_15290 [Lacibacter sp.]
MPSLSFDIKSTKDFYNKLLEEYEDFQNNKTSTRIALNCAMTAWHLTEWVYHELSQKINNAPKSISLSKKEIKDFQDELKKQCLSLQIVNDLTDGTKHCLLSRNATIKETEFYVGEFSDEFSREFNTDSLNIFLNDGRELNFETEINTVIAFWEEYLKEKQLI